ncbi:MAG: TIGR01777 family oxidoreductase [Terriglobales bacterium]
MSGPENPQGSVLVSGASGLIGSALVAALESAGNTVKRLVRTPPRDPSREIYWDPAGSMDRFQIEGYNAVVHLAGETIMGRWTEKKKARIRDSRLQGTRTLATHLARCEPRPRVLVCASAVGYYGDRGEEILREDSPPGTDFLAEVGRGWEEAAQPAAQAGIRVVNLRLGVVLSRRGGALKQMLLPFRLGLGGRLGSGRQYMSWISLDDVVGAVRHALENDSLRGAVNAVAPNPVTNAEFTRTLGRVLGRPTILPAPAFAIRLLLGEMGESLLLSSQRVEPRRLLDSGYAFQHPELRSALEAMLEHRG